MRGSNEAFAASGLQPATDVPHSVPRVKLPQPAVHELDEPTKAFYLRCMDLLDRAGVRYMVGGAYSLAYHAGIERHTKDLDLFVHADACQQAMDVLEAGGYRVERTFPHWLAKAYWEDAFIDLIYGSGNGLCPVDDEWMENAVQGEALGRPALLCPAEEIIWSKCFIQERERYDGADINHMLLYRGQELDWDRLLRRFAGKERILLGHLLFYGFAFPAEKDQVPRPVLERLWEAVRDEPATTERVCQGAFLSRGQYLIDLNARGYADARLHPRGPMRAEHIKDWTDAIEG